MSVLKADHISIQFGGLRAVNDFSIDLNLGDISAIIGPFEAMHALNKARRNREEAEKRKIQNGTPDRTDQ